MLISQGGRRGESTATCDVRNRHLSWKKKGEGIRGSRDDSFAKKRRERGRKKSSQAEKTSERKRRGFLSPSGETGFSKGKVKE